MADEAREEVRRRTDLVELVSARVSLRRAGKSYVGLCPFHDDKRPSFHVSPDTGRYRCFACGEKGDVFDWVMKTQGLDFREALLDLAHRAGVEVGHGGSGVSAAERSERDAREGAMEIALNFFREQLERSPAAREYLAGRGLGSEVVARWHLGYAPDAGEALASRLRKGGVPLSLARELFLVEEDGRGGYYDRFRGRIVFPIRDERGRLVAFGGRLLREGQPKYINSGDTPLYSKSRVLYGASLARERWTKSRSATLAEGYLDVIALHEAGVDDAVASLGTSLTGDHATLLARFVDRVTILYDGDEAGYKATERAIETLAATRVIPRVALPAAGDDPDSLLRRAGAEAVRRLASSAISAFSFRVRSLERRLASSDPEFWPEAAALLAKAPTEIELESELVRLAGSHPTLRDPLRAQQALRRDVEALRPDRRETRRTRAVADLPTESPLQPVELVIFGAISDERARPRAWRALDLASTLLTEAGRSLARHLQETFPDGPPTGPPRDWIHRLGLLEQQILADAMFDLRAQGATEDDVEAAEQYLLRRQRSRGVTRLRAEAATDDAAAREAMRTLREIKSGDDGPNDPSGMSE